MPDSDEIQLRLQAYQLAIQQGTTPDTVYSWLTQEGTPGAVASLHVLPTPDTSHDHDHYARVREQFHPAGRGRTAPPAEPPPRNFLQPDAAEDLARAFLASVRIYYGNGGRLMQTFRSGTTDTHLAMLLAASDQADAFYGPN